MAIGGLRTTFSFDPSSVLRGLAAAKAEYNRRAKRAITLGVLFFEREVKKELSKPGTGRSYPRGRKVHIASAPGEPPAVDTGQLRASITHLVEVEFLKYVGHVGSNLDKATHLEFGTKNMAARPFLRTTLARIQPQLLAIFAAELKGLSISSKI